jgi:tetratricopeptide (TPR) repeat protein
VEAQKSISKAVDITPENVEYLNNLGTTYRSLNQNELAVGAFRKAVAIDPEFVGAGSNLAEALNSVAQFAEAEKICRQILQDIPDHAAAYLILGRVLLNRSKHEEAVPILQKYVELSPGQVKGYLALAGVQNILGDYKEAEKTLDFAATIDPNSVEVMQLQGMLQLQLGNQDLAKEKLENAILLDADLSPAYFDLSQLKNSKLTQHQSDHLKQMLSRDDVVDAPRATATFTPARVAEKSGDVAGAFSFLEDANKIRLSLLESLGYSFDANTFTKYIQEQIDFFSPGFFKTIEASEDSSKKAVFIVGLPRSGTTLVERIIASHPEAHGAGELTEIENLAGSIKSIQESYPEGIAALEPSQSHELSNQYLAYINSKASTVIRVVDKNPFNFLHLGLIRMLFPKAAILHCRRDLRDVGLSCFMQNFSDPLPWTNDLRSIGQYFNQYDRLMNHWRGIEELDFLTIDYEELVSKFDETARTIISHVGLEWDNKCLDFHETAGGVQTASSAQVREPIYQRSVGRWKLYENQLKPMIEVLDLAE